MNYAILVPSMYAFMARAAQALPTALSVPARFVRRKSASTLLAQLAQRELRSSGTVQTLLALMALVVPALYLRNILTDAKPVSVWIESVSFRGIGILAWTHYLLINAILTWFLGCTLYRWVRVGLYLRRAYCGRSPCLRLLDGRVLSPSHGNPSFGLGRVALYWGVVALCVALNYLTYYYAYAGGQPDAISPNNPAYVATIRWAYLLALIPPVVVILPLLPVVWRHSRLRSHISRKLYRNLCGPVPCAGAPNNELLLKPDSVIAHVRDHSDLMRTTILPIEPVTLRYVLIPWLLTLIGDAIKRFILGG